MKDTRKHRSQLVHLYGNHSELLDMELLDPLIHTWNRLFDNHKRVALSN
jgi:hypothetical protein